MESLTSNSSGLSGWRTNGCLWSGPLSSARLGAIAIDLSRYARSRLNTSAVKRSGVCLCVEMGVAVRLGGGLAGGVADALKGCVGGDGVRDGIDRCKSHASGSIEGELTRSE